MVDTQDENLEALQNIPPTAPTKMRLRSDSLTPFEKAQLAADGSDVDDEFVDVDLTEGPRPTVNNQERQQRTDMVNKLASPLRQRPEENGGTPQDHDRDREVVELREQIDDMQKAHDETRCPRCSWKVTESLLEEPSEEDVAEFLRTACALEPFSLSFTLLNGALTVTYVAISSKASRIISDIISRKVRSESINSMSEIVFHTNRLTFMASVSEMRSGDSGRSFSSTWMEQDNQEEALVEGFAELPDHVLTMLESQYFVFKNKVEVLTARASDPLFWGHHAS